MKKHMKPLTNLKSEELIKKITELKVEINDLRRGIKTGDVQNTQAAKSRKRELARIKTLMRNPAVADKATQPADKKKAAPKTAVKEKK